jgi:hypothetical protein
MAASSGLNVCSHAKKIMEFDNLLWQSYNSKKLNIETICKTLDTISKNIKSCQEELYICKEKTRDDSKSFNLTSTELFRDDVFFSTPRKKAIFYINWFPNIKLVQDVYKELDSSDFNKEEKNIFNFNKKLIDEILDNKEFIKSIYKYIWACLYSYDICTLIVEKFKDFLIILVNERTRNNYIICDCNEENKDKMGMGYNAPINIYAYTCGRALGYILTPEKTTRFVIYNTESTESDLMNHDYFDRIRNELKGGRVYKKTNKKIKKYTPNKSKKLKKFKNKK